MAETPGAKIASKQPRDNPLVQQRMKAFRPIHSFRSSVMILSGVFLALFSVGLALCLKAADAKEMSIRYDDKCSISPGKTLTCSVDFEVSEGLPSPILVYYKLVDFYQNHRFFVRSRNYKQLAGSLNADLASCSPIDESEDISPTLHMIDGRILETDATLNPCGLAAKTFFNDSFQLLTNNSATVFIDTEDISWQSDRDYMFKRPENFTAIQWTDVEDEHFIVWMRSAEDNTFLKLWGRVNEPLATGNYTLIVDNRYDVSKWSGEKHFYLISPTIWGGTSTFLGALYMAASGIALVFLLYIWLKRSTFSQVSAEDAELKWD